MKTNFKFKTQSIAFVYAILAVAIFSSNKVNGQSLISSDSIKNNYPATINENLFVRGNFRIGENIKNDFSNQKFIIFNRDVTEVIKISSNGEFLYTPKYFCDCKKCKKFKGMRKLNVK